ncbi:MAG TPA: hypothetical protein VGE93_10360, partial [Bryobacteraceae bacterium]
MATPSFSPEPRSSLSRRIAISVSVLLVLVGMTVGIAAWWFHHAALAAMPQLDGTLQVAGLS